MNTQVVVITDALWPWSQELAKRLAKSGYKLVLGAQNIESLQLLVNTIK